MDEGAAHHAQHRGGLCGLDAPTPSETIKVMPKSHYTVGDRIGLWPIFALTENEHIAGRDNKHLDFRLSLLRECHEGELSVVVSTICNVHIMAGKVYLLFIVPFHKWGLRSLIARSMASGRL